MILDILPKTLKNNNNTMDNHQDPERKSRIRKHIHRLCIHVGLFLLLLVIAGIIFYLTR